VLAAAGTGRKGAADLHPGPTLTGVLAAPPEAGEQGSNTRLSYRPALDGLRALAVVAVLAYHAGVGWARAGFLGVDVFFVLSGYLITALLLAEWQQEGGISLVRFWRRRARRLLPALIVMLAAVAVAVPLLAPDQVDRLRGDLLAALGYVSNWRFIFEDQSYFAGAGRPPLLQHLWSLAVEEQFYLLWPPVLTWWLHRHGRRPWPDRRAKTFATGLVRPLLLAGAASAVLMALLYEPYTDPTRVYYGTDTRAAALLVGAALACTATRWQVTDRIHPVGRTTLEVVGGLGLVGLALAIAKVDEFDPGLYRGGFLWVAFLAAAVVASAAQPAGGLGPVTAVLASRPLVWLGRRSYAIYLWFWPVYMLTRPHRDVELSGLPLLGLRVGLTVALAALSYRLVEQPIRAGALRTFWRDVRRARATGTPLHRPSVAWGLVMAVAMTCVGTGVALNHRSNQPTTLTTGEAAALGIRLPQAGVGLNVAAVNALTTTTTVAPTTAPPTTVAEPTTTAAPARAVEAPATVTTVPASLPTISAHVTAIGDSVLLGAKPILEQHIEGIVVDAAVGRQFADVLALARAYRDGAKLGHMVLIQAGNNGPINPAQFEALLELLRDVRRVVIVNAKVDRSWQDHNNQVMASAVPRWPNAVIADWHAAASAHPDAFYDDGLHLTSGGMRLFAETVLAVM
jgi:peptidoglycan/LPS O-acetylase OafA/YrhL